MSNKKYLWDYKDAELDNNNLEEKKEPTFQEWNETFHYTPGQATGFVVDDKEAEEVRDLIKDRGAVHYGADDVQELIAADQSTANKWANALIKLAPKTLNVAVGGIAMLPSAIGTTADWLVGGLEEGEAWKDIYDNDFHRSLDGINEWLDKELPNYYTKEEQKMGFIRSIGTANFVNDFTNGLSFVAGAVLSELALSAATAATFGAAAPAQGAGTVGIVSRAASTLKNISKGKAVTNPTRGTKVAEKFYNTVPKLGSRIKAGGMLGRRLLTGAGYESGVEARHHIDSVYSELSSAEEAKLGRPLTQEEQADIYDLASASGNAVFTANLALVGVGNIVAFPKLFGPGYKTASKNWGNVMRGLKGDLTSPYVAAHKAWSKQRNFLNAAYHVLKRPAYEGFVEEGGQSWLDVAGQHSAADFYMRGKRPTQLESVKGLIQGMHQTAVETFGSNQTQKEMGIGFLLGALGLPTYSRTRGTETVDPKTGKKTKGKREWGMMGGSYGSYQDMKAAQNRSEALADYANKYPDAFQALKSNFDLLVKDGTLSEEMDVAMATNNMFAWKSAKDDQFFNYVRSRTQAGYFNDVVDDIESIRQLDNKTFAEAFGYDPEMSDTELSARKDKVVESALRKANLIKKASKTIDNLYQGENDAIRESMEHALASVELVGIREESILDKIDELTDGKLNLRASEGVSKILKETLGSGTVSFAARAAEIREQLKQNSNLGPDHPNKFPADTVQELEAAAEMLEKGLGDLQYSNAVDDIEFMKKWQAEDPDGYNASPHRNEVAQMLSDLRKLRERRQDAIRMYNQLNTNLGEAEFNKHVEYYTDAYAKQEKARQEAATEEAVETQDPQALYNVNSEAEFIIKDPKNGKDLLVKFADKDHIQGVEDPSRRYSSKLLATHFVRTASPSTVEVDPEPTNEGEISVETSEEYDLPIRDQIKKPSLEHIGFGKTAGQMSGDMSPEQQNFYNYLHSTTNFSNVEIELVSPKNNKYSWLEFYDKDDIKAVVVNKKSGTPKKFKGDYVHTSIMLPELTKDGTPRFYDLDSLPKEFIDARVEEFKQLRKTAAEGNVRLPITGRSALFASQATKDNINNEAYYSIVKRIVPTRKDIADVDLRIATSNKVPINAIEYNVIPGLPFIVHNQMPITLFKRTLTEKENTTITNLLVMYSQNMISKDPSVQENPDQILDSAVGQGENLKIIDAIRSMIRFGGYKDGASNPEYQIKLTNKGVLLKGRTALTWKALANEDPKAIDKLKTFLSNKIHDINNNILRSNDVYYHVSLTEEGLDVQDYTNYKEYLLAPRELTEEIPYRTALAPMSTDMDAPQFAGGYLTFDIPSAATTPKKESTDSRPAAQKEVNKFDTFQNIMTEGTEWALEGVSTKGEPRSANFKVVSQNGAATVVVLPGEDKLYSAWIQEIIQPNLVNPDYALANFHIDVRGIYEMSVDDYNKVKPRLYSKEVTRVNPFEAVEEQTANTRNDIKQKVEDVPGYLYSYKGVPVLHKTDIVTQEGTPGTAQRTTLFGGDVIYINKTKMKAAFKSKAWTTPRKLKDGTSIIPIPTNAFPTLKAFESFIIEHEYQHTQIKQKKGETMGEYEDRINQAAFKALTPEDESTANESPNPFGRTRNRRAPGDTKALESQRKLRGKYKKINIAEERQWFEGKFNMPFNTMKGLVSGSNYGEFRQLADVMISEMAIEGTTFHEAFHVVHDYFWTPEEKAQIYRDYKKYTKQPNITNAQIEEELAEEFRHYMLKDGLSVVPPVKGLKAWFKRLWDFIKSLGTSERYSPEGIRLANLFESIRTTDYRTPKHEKTALLNRFLISINPTTKTLEGANVSETKAILDGFVNSVFDELDKEESSLHFTDLLNLTTNTEVTAEFGVLMQHGFENMLGVLRNQVQEQLADGTWADRTDVSTAERNAVYDNAEFLQANQAEIFDLFTDWLETFGINMEIELNETEATKENNFGATHQVLETSARGNSPNVIKLLIASLPINSATSTTMGLYGLVDYTNVFDSLHNELAGVQDFAGQVQAIKNMAMNRPDIAQPLGVLLNRLKATHQPSELNFKQISLRNKFIQQFDKTKNTYYLNLIKDPVTIHATDSNTSRTEDKIRNDWRSNFREMALSEKGFFKINDETGGIILDPNKKFKFGAKQATYKTLPKFKGDSYFNFLDLLGINFTNKAALKNNPDLLTEIMDHVINIKEFFLNKQANDTALEVEDLFREEDSGIAARLNKLVSMELPYYTNTIELQHITPEGKRAYGITLGNFMTRVANSLSRGVVPKYLQDAGTTVSGSKWLETVQKGGGINVVILEGATEDEKGSTGNVTKNLTPTDRDAMYINNTLNGRYPMLQASEKKTVFGFEILDKKGVIGARKINRARSISDLLGHLKNEIEITLNLVRDNKGNDIKGFKNTARGLRAFDYLNAMPLPGGKTLIDVLQDEFGTISADEIMKQNYTLFAGEVALNVDKHIEETTERLIKNGMLKIYPSGLIHLKGIDAETFGKTLGLTRPTNKEGNKIDYKQVIGEKLKLTPEELRQFVEAFVLRDQLSALEQLKLFFGDLAFFTETSLYKRTAGPHGVKKFAITGEFISDWLNQNIKRFDNKIADDRVRTIMLRDVTASSQYYNEYAKLVGPEIADAYLNYNEADAQGFITIDEYIEFLTRTSDITEKHLDLYQKVQEGLPLTSEEMIYFTPLKPQYYGPSEAEGMYSPAYYKLSLAVLLPQMLQRVNPKNGIMEETALARLHEDMVNNQVGIAVFESGIKIGGKVDPASGLSQRFYNRTGEYSKMNPNNIQTLYYDYLGVQVDMGTAVKDKSSSGTQRRALILANLMENGKGDESTVKSYNDAHNAMTNHNFQNFVHKLGFKADSEAENGYVQVADAEYLKEALLNETRQRKLNDNEMDGLELLLESEDQFLELVSNKPALDSVLHSLFARDVIEKKRFGGAYAQVSSTGSEIASEGRGITLKAMKQSDHSYGSNTSPLKFYRMSKDGKRVLGMEVMLPHYFKEFLGNEIRVINNQIVDADGNVIAGKELLDIFAFRIPTTGLGTIEVISIKGFLPKEAGEAVMTPSEIVVKSGSDYDIDKLTLIFPNYTVIREGNAKRLVKIPYLSEKIEDLEKVQALRRYDRPTYKRFIEEAGLKEGDVFRKAFDDINKELNKYKKDLFDLYNTEEVAKLDGKISLLKEDRATAKTASKRKLISNQIEDLIMDKMAIVSGYTNQIYKIEESFNELDKALAKSSYFKSLPNEYKNATKALENREIDISRDIATRPEMLAQLLRPTGAARLEQLADRLSLDTGIPLQEDLSYNSILGFNHRQNMGQRFWEGKAALGIAALENTMHVKMQQTNATQTVTDANYKFAELLQFEEEDSFERDEKYKEMKAKIAAQYGEADKTYVNYLGFSKDQGKTGYYVNEMLGEFVNAFVDVANKPFVYGLNANMETANTIFTLLRKGMSIDTIGTFLMQPALRDLTAEVPKAKSFILNLSRKDIVDNIYNKYEDIAGKERLDPQEIHIEQLQRGLMMGRDFESLSKQQQQTFGALQLAVLDMYKQARLDARDVSQVTSALAYDTNPPMNRMAAKIKQLKLQKIGAYGFKTGFSVDIGTLTTDSWMSQMVTATNEILPLYKDFYLVDTSPIVERMLDEIISKAAYKPEHDLIAALNILEHDYVTFLLSGLTDLESETSQLLQGPNSVARRWRAFQKANPDNLLSKELFSELQIHKDPKNLGYNIDGVRAFARKLPALESNLLTEAFMELYNGSPAHRDLAIDLMKVAILQYGMNKSPRSFMRIVPAGLYSKIAKEMVDEYKISRSLESKGIISSDTADDMAFLDQFPKNNWNNDMIVPTVRPVSLTPDMSEEDMRNAYPRMEDGVLYMRGRDATYVKTWVVDPSISEEKRKRLEKAGKRLPVVARLFKAIPGSPEDKLVAYKNVPKLGNGVNLKEYSLNSQKSSIINLNNDLIGSTTEVKTQIKDTRTPEEKVFEGNIFDLNGIPVIPINLQGDHADGIALQAKKLNLIQDKFDNSYQAGNTNKINNFTRGRLIITVPIKGSATAPINLELLSKGMAKVAAIAKANPNQKILVPLSRDSNTLIDDIIPVYKKLMTSSPNISIVLASTSNLTQRGIEDNEVIKKLLNC